MNITLNNDINVGIHITPKKKKGNTELYDLYLTYTIARGGITQITACLSTGIKTPVDQFENEKIKGRGENARLYNDRITCYLAKSKDVLETLRLKSCKSCSEVKNVIITTLKAAITGKAPRGSKSDYRDRLMGQTYELLMDGYFSYRNVSSRRRKKYERTLELLKEYYQTERDENLPLIPHIEIDDLEQFKGWYNDTYVSSGRHKLNTSSTYLGTIPAIFNFAVKKKIINASPVPIRFTDGWEKGERDILEEDEILAVMEFNGGLKHNQTELSKTDRIAKLCMLLQVLVGMGYGDQQQLTREHIKHINGETIIQKKRNKTNVEFTIVLTTNAKNVLAKLRELTWKDERLDLPSIEYIGRRYKLIAKAAGITKNVTTYTLRHTFAVNFLDNGGTMEDLQKILGHIDPKNTRLYGEISKRRLTLAKNKLEENSQIHKLNLNI